MSGHDNILSARWLRDLGAMEEVPVGTRIRVEEDGFVYTSVGAISPEIAIHIDRARQTIWIPEHAEMGILRKHTVFPDLIAAAHAVLIDPLSVHEDRSGHGYLYLVVPAERLRRSGLLASRSTDLVDGVVELRHVSGGNLLRLFHLAPTDRNKGSRQLWP